MVKCYQHPHHDATTTCRICKSPCCHECGHATSGICSRCGYKILIVLIVIMVIVSYSAWFGVF